MHHDELWDLNYERMMQFLQRRRCRPSKYCVEERQMLNWFKHNKKKLARGTLPEHRIERFQVLLEEASRWQRRNQYAYVENHQNELFLFPDL